MLSSDGGKHKYTVCALFSASRQSRQRSLRALSRYEGALWRQACRITLALRFWHRRGELRLKVEGLQFLRAGEESRIRKAGAMTLASLGGRQPNRGCRPGPT